MASAIIHLAVAKTLEKHFNISSPRDYYLGTIAPDIAKLLGETKKRSHFLINTEDNIPNIKLFIEKYPNFKSNSFDLGYFIHLYTDKIWFKNFIPTFISDNHIKLLDGTVLNTTPKEIQKFVYHDYTNLNTKLLDQYNMDLSLFYEDFYIPKTTINEIPKNKLNILIDKMGLIIENSKEKKPYSFDEYLILDFIDKTTQEILNFLNIKEA